MKEHIHTWNDFDENGRLRCSNCGIREPTPIIPKEEKDEKSR